MPRPGPRSTKQSVILHKRGSLGDTSDDDNSVDRTSSEGKENRDANFHSPEIENDATDYGLEFTTSNIQNPSPRRCSTFKAVTSQEEELTSAERTKGRNQQSVVSQEAKKQNASKRLQEQAARRGGDGDDSASDDNEEEEEDGSDHGHLSEAQLARAERSRRRKQLTVSKEAKKQNARKGVKEQTARRGGDSDDSATAAEEESSARRHLPDKQLAERSKGRKQIVSKEAKTQIASKEQTKQHASKVTKKQSVTDDSATDEDEEGRLEGDHSQRTSKEDNTPSNVTQKFQGNSKKPTKTKQNPSKLKSQPATKISAPHEKSEQTPMSRASRGSTTAKQISQGPHERPTQAVALKKARKQKNPIQKDLRFFREVNALQARCDNLIPRLPFSRVIRQIMMEASRHVTQITPTALEALQTASEMYLTQRLQDAYMLTIHRGRVTLDVRDMELTNYLKMNM